MKKLIEALTEISAHLRAGHDTHRAFLIDEAIDKLKLVDELPWRPRDIRRGLILFRTSNNAHGFTNYQSIPSKIEKLPASGRDELAAIMTNMAIQLSRDAVERNGVVKSIVAQRSSEIRDKALDDAAMKVAEICIGNVDEPARSQDPLYVIEAIEQMKTKPNPKEVI